MIYKNLVLPIQEPIFSVFEGGCGGRGCGDLHFFGQIGPTQPYVAASEAKRFLLYNGYMYIHIYCIYIYILIYIYIYIYVYIIFNGHSPTDKSQRFYSGLGIFNWCAQHYVLSQKKRHWHDPPALLACSHNLPTKSAKLQVPVSRPAASWPPSSCL
jgi:hypothetical protein